MCTVSWMHELDGYQLFCNRDEKRSRAEADPPRTLHRDGVRFLAPLDSECGGTWIATNQFGISLCLLNGTAARAAPGYRSRGLLVLDLIPSPSLADLAHRVSLRDLSPFQPFTLLALEPSRPAIIQHWDGYRLSVTRNGDLAMPLCSSSFDPDTVAGSRRRLFAQMSAKSCRLHSGVLLAFHRSHAPVRGACSPCMHRLDVETRSFSWISVKASETNFFYEAGCPCESLVGASHTLERTTEETCTCPAWC